MRINKLPLSVAFVAALAMIGLSLVPSFSPKRLLNRLLVPRTGWTLNSGVAYGPDERQKLDIYRPSATGSTEAFAAPAPVIVFLYGGGWRNGSRQFYRFVGEALTRRGFVVAIPDYRLYPEVRFPTFVEDAAAAVLWVSRHAGEFGGDPTRLVLMGHSAGAHIAALLASDRHYLRALPEHHLRAFIGLAGPYAIDPLDYDDTRPVFAPASAETTKPLALVRGCEPPMLLLHGTTDATVEPINSERLATAVTEQGGEAKAILLPGTGHMGIILAFAAPFRRNGGIADLVTAFASREALSNHQRPQPQRCAAQVIANANDISGTGQTAPAALNPAQSNVWDGWPSG